MYESYASQYGVPAVVVEQGDKASEVINYAKEVGAVTYEGRDRVLVVQFLGRRAPECFSEQALARSFRKRYVRKTAVAGVEVVFFTEEAVPEGTVEKIVGSAPRAGISLTVAPIKIGGQVIEAFSIRS